MFGGLKSLVLAHVILLNIVQFEFLKDVYQAMHCNDGYDSSTKEFISQKAAIQIIRNQ